MLRRFYLSILTVFSVLVVACSGGGTIEAADSYDSLAAALESAGMKIDNRSENGFLFANIFSVTGIEITASGEHILAFEFDTPEEASKQASMVSEDGFGIGLKYINWGDTPQFYKNGNMIVVYDGSQNLVTRTLASAMGDKFAGGTSDGT
ncbi:MAG: hypothetical protein O3B95_11555 [Chloroflexi bacterium]|nr:hypothetical protein [Chloroflexota bacterium]